MDSILKYYLNNAEKILVQHGLNVCFVIFFTSLTKCLTVQFFICVLMYYFFFLHGLLFFFYLIAYLLSVFTLRLITLACEWVLRVSSAFRVQQWFTGDCYFRNLIRLRSGWTALSNGMVRLHWRLPMTSLFLPHVITNCIPPTLHPVATSNSHSVIHSAIKQIVHISSKFGQTDSRRKFVLST